MLPSCRCCRTADREEAAQREAAIVTRVPGTTRDILELSLDIGGLPVSVADTAGLRETVDEIEQIGIERARSLYVPLCFLLIGAVGFAQIGVIGFR